MEPEPPLPLEVTLGQLNERRSRTKKEKLKLLEDLDRRPYTEATLGDFVDACLDCNLDFALTLPFCGQTIDHFRNSGILVPAKTSKYEVYVLYAEDGKPYFREGQNLHETKLDPGHFTKNGAFDLAKIRRDFKLEGSQPPWASFRQFLRVRGEEEASRVFSDLQSVFGKEEGETKLFQWLLLQAVARAGKILFEEPSMLSAWNGELARLNKRRARDKKKEIKSIEDVDRLEVSPDQREQELNELEEQFMESIGPKDPQGERAKKKQKFMRLTVAQKLHQLAGYLSKRGEPTFSGLHNIYLLGFMDGVLVATDPDDPKSKWYERLKQTFRSIRSAEDRNKEWEKHKAKVAAALQEAEERWAKGDPTMHNKMAEQLAPKYGLTKKALQTELRPLAREYGRIRGEKKENPGKL
jgi:hypothetical protein